MSLSMWIIIGLLIDELREPISFVADSRTDTDAPWPPVVYCIYILSSVALAWRSE